MKPIISASTRIAALFLGAALLCTGCEPKGPAEQAGQKVDQGVQNVKDTISPPGPVEKAGRTVDKALEK